MEPDMLGAQRTFLSTDLRDRELSINLRQKLAIRGGITTKFWGSLNTVSMDTAYKLAFKKHFGGFSSQCSGWMQVAKDADEERYGGYSKKRRMSPELSKRVNIFFPSGFGHALFAEWSGDVGVQLSNIEKEPLQYIVAVAKKPQYMKHFTRTDCFVECGAQAAYSPSSRETAWRLKPRLHLLRSDVTPDQDMRVAIGYDLEAHTSSTGTYLFKDVFFSIGDNRWTASFKKNAWKLTIDM